MMTAELATTEDYEWCREVARANARNFYYSFWTLPKREQAALCAIYAFCRHCDDIVDMDLPETDAVERIAATRAALADAFVGKPDGHLFRALADVVREFSIPREIFEEHIRGNEMDLTIRRYGTFDELRQYCYRVASAVGLMCLPVFGATSGAAREYAETLGLILQLTNIARDVKEDAARDRIYLPREELRRFRVKEEDILASRFTPEFAALMKSWRERIEGLEQKLDAIELTASERRALLAPEIMRAIYARLRGKMAAAADDVFAQRVRLSGAHKVALAAAVWWRGRAFAVTHARQ